MMTSQILFSLVVLLGVLACVRLGRRIGVSGAAGDKGATDIVDGAVFGLLSLLIAFTFSGAASRFDGRRQLMGQEANAIGTAYLRLDVLAPEAQGPLKEKFRHYADARIALFRKLPDLAAARMEADRARQLQAEIWSAAIEALRGTPPPLTLPVLAPINEMIDITTTQRVATETHPPGVIYGVLAGLALVTGLLLGRRMAAAASHNTLNAVLYACVLASVVYVIRDLEFPRLGFIRVDTADHVLSDVRQDMK